MLPELNPISIILALLVAAGGMVGGYVVHDTQVQDVQENSFEDLVKANVTQVDNEIQALKAERETIGLGQFRANCQNSQQFITEKWQAASRDSGMSAEDRKLNAEYKEFLLEASRIIDVYLARSNPDFSEYESRRDKILFR
jgi:hypothetical protein